MSMNDINYITWLTFQRIAPQADQQAHIHPGEVNTQPAVYTMPSGLEISQVDT